MQVDSDEDQQGNNRQTHVRNQSSGSEQWDCGNWEMIGWTTRHGTTYARDIIVPAAIEVNTREVCGQSTTARYLKSPIKACKDQGEGNHQFEAQLDVLWTWQEQRKQEKDWRYQVEQEENTRIEGKNNDVDDKHPEKDEDCSSERYISIIRSGRPRNSRDHGTKRAIVNTKYCLGLEEFGPLMRFRWKVNWWRTAEAMYKARKIVDGAISWTTLGCWPGVAFAWRYGGGGLSVR
ncbi:hypothetical protein CC78DRAFT_585389 [Lojkania enalia]|uniref:Uncharacterized protein n=1 Tax=Lojkania enalia TaxID=147567 RepID=A0A9P4K0M7_9PLEO|nr:hypothetical protein CC78DRAFT_585389 [Didymosphaeria enalia]